MNMRTKIFILLVVSAVALFSCEKYIPVDLPGPEKLLQVNALMTTGDTLHFVYAGISTHKEVTRLESGRMECWVNGRLVATSDTLERASKAYTQNVFRFKADFKAGDEIRIVVESDGMRAEATTVAPDAPILAGVDTVHLKKKTSKGEYYKTLGLGVHVKDNPDEKNYYMLQVWRFGGSYNSQLEIDNSSEPLLNSGLNTDYNGGASSSDNYFSNGYNIFTDKGFEGGSHIFRISLSSGFSSGVTVRLLALDRKTYNYINAVWFEQADISSLTFFTPKPYPTNVTGDGLGLVSVMTSADFKID